MSGGLFIEGAKRYDEAIGAEFQVSYMSDWATLLSLLEEQGEDSRWLYHNGGSKCRCFLGKKGLYRALGSVA